MKRFVSILISISMLLLVFSGCSGSDQEQSTEPQHETTQVEQEDPAQTSLTEDKPEITTSGNETPETTEPDGSTGSPATPAEGYGKYVEMKSGAYERISAKIEVHDELALTVGMALLPVIMIDLSLIIVSVLGMEGGEAALRMLAAEDVVVEQNGQVYSVTYTDEEGGKFLQTTEYFPDADALKSTITTDGTEAVFFEYTKAGNGYASHYYTLNEESNDYTLITTFFDESNITAFGVATINAPPESIIGKSDLTSEFVVNDEMYVILENDILTALIDGELKTY